MGGGFYNHVDDPDEFWDDEPIVRGAAPPVVEVVAEPPPLTDPAPSTPVLGAPLVSVAIDGGCLPIGISTSPGWDPAPHTVAGEFMAAYRAAVSDRIEQLCGSGRWPTERQISDAAVPDLRTMWTLLLETGTWAEFSRLSSELISNGRFHGSGRAVVHGERAVTVIADRTYIRSIAVRGDWAATADPDEICDEILHCADQIRAMRPRLVARGDYARWTDAELEHELDIHRLRLLDSEVHRDR
ncbi:hypothetical protein [Nocardia sp. NPDC057227]|uniref:hypothetical protein n=1 Tax=Nocardia sp. NPDC057227 TaxID=3346056 RepID=UPI00362A92EE